MRVIPVDVLAVCELPLRRLPRSRSGILSSVVDYDSVPAAPKLTVPFRAVNSHLYRTDIAAIRKVKGDLDATVWRHMGRHYMFERPDKFKPHVTAIVAALDKPQ